MTWQLSTIIGAVMAFAISLMLHNFSVDRLQHKQQGVIATQIETDALACNKAKEITRKTEEDYESQIIARDIELKRLREQPAKTIRVYIAKPPGGADAADQPKQPDTGNGIADNKLYDFAGSCETDRLKVISLQQFITKLYEINNELLPKQ